MLGAAVIVFRETLEAALILGILAAATRELTARNRWLGLGVLGGVAGALVVAALMDNIAGLAEGTGQDLFNAAVLGIAVAMLAWHNIWMARHGAELARDAKALGRDVASGARALHALALVVSLAVLREGSETVLFLYGMLTGGSESAMNVAGGGVLGLLAGTLAGVGLYAGFVRIPVKWFFAATSALILLLAASMASQAAKFLVQADVLPSFGSPLWDTSTILSNDSPLGILLHTLAGYEAAPSGVQVMFYMSAIVLIFIGMRVTREKPQAIAR